MQYKNDKTSALDHYIDALSLGGTRTLPELYKTADLEFNFSGQYMKTLMRFLRDELQNLLNNN